jgi:hypothetical protein
MATEPQVSAASESSRATTSSSWSSSFGTFFSFGSSSSNSKVTSLSPPPPSTPSQSPPDSLEGDAGPDHQINEGSLSEQDLKQLEKEFKKCERLKEKMIKNS